MGGTRRQGGPQGLSTETFRSESYSPCLSAMAFALGRSREPAPAKCLPGASLYAWRFPPLTSFKSHDNSVRDSPSSSPLPVAEGQVQRVAVVSSRPRAQAGLLTGPRAS